MTNGREKALIIIHKFRKQQKRDDKVAGILPKVMSDSLSLLSSRWRGG